MRQIPSTVTKIIIDTSQETYRWDVKAGMSVVAVMNAQELRDLCEQIYSQYPAVFACCLAVEWPWTAESAGEVESRTQEMLPLHWDSGIRP